MPDRPQCIIEVGHQTLSADASWLMNGKPDRPICDRHKGYYETAYDDYSDIEWVPIGGADSVTECWNCSWHYSGDICPNPECAQGGDLTDEERAAVIEFMALTAGAVVAEHSGRTGATDGR